MNRVSRGIIVKGNGGSMKLRYIILILIFSFLLCSCMTTKWEERISEAQAKMDSLSDINGSQDTWNLRHDADFEVMVADGVWWVPANTLGKSRYTNEQIASIVNENPRVKKALIGNLYEAIQLFQICDFSGADDDNDGGLDPYLYIWWEKHTPGYYAVYINHGGCATDTNWLIYLLEDDYDDWGTMHYQESDGSGHVINYFHVDGFYYFIDMTHYRNDFAESAVEDGNKNTYRNTDFIAGNIHKASSPEAYVNYCLKEFNTPPSFFYMIKGHEVPDLKGRPSEKPVRMILDSRIKKDLTVIYIDEEIITYGFYLNSSPTPDWNKLSRHPYSAITDFQQKPIDIDTIQISIKNN